MQEGTHAYLDVRTPEEFSAGHSPKAVNVPVMLKGAGGQMQPNLDFLAQAQAAFPDKSVPLVVGCKSGKRSAVAADMLVGAGHSGEVLNLAGGFDAWQASGLPVQQP